MWMWKHPPTYPYSPEHLEVCHCPVVRVHRVAWVQLDGLAVGLDGVHVAASLERLIATTLSTLSTLSTLGVDLGTMQNKVSCIASAKGSPEGF